jgi:hypothetical protein
MPEDNTLPVGPIDPIALEQQLVEEQVNAAHASYDPIAGAAGIFGRFLPQYKGLVRRLSNRQMKRLLCALIEVPLQKQDYKHPTKEEQAAFLLGDRLLQAKMTMIIHTVLEQQKKDMEARVNAPPPGAVPVEEVLTQTQNSGNIENTEGESNGEV